MMQETIGFLIRTFVPFDQEEETTRQRMLDLLELGPSAWNRNHFDPGHFTASSYVVDPSSRHIVLIYHKHLNRWLQPGGHIEPTDLNIIASAQRELREETGLNHAEDWQLIDLDIHLIPARLEMPEHLHFDLRFLCLLPSGKSLLPLFPSDDAVHAKWTPMQTLAHHQEPGFARSIKKIFSFLD